jgi:hypothetical protein
MLIGLLAHEIGSHPHPNARLRWGKTSISATSSPLHASWRERRKQSFGSCKAFTKHFSRTQEEDRGSRTRSLGEVQSDEEKSLLRATQACCEDAARLPVFRIQNLSEELYSHFWETDFRFPNPAEPHDSGQGRSLCVGLCE